MAHRDSVGFVMGHHAGIRSPWRTRQPVVPREQNAGWVAAIEHDSAADGCVRNDSSRCSQIDVDDAGRKKLWSAAVIDRGRRGRRRDWRHAALTGWERRAEGRYETCAAGLDPGERDVVHGQLAAAVIDGEFRRNAPSDLTAGVTAEAAAILTLKRRRVEDRV